MVTLTELEPLINEVASEVIRAESLFNRFNSAHEGYAVMLEEMDELWDEVKKGGTQKRSIERMREEALQVAAMGIRFILNLCDD